MIAPGDLAVLRGIAAGTFDQVCTILEAILESDGRGGNLEIWRGIAVDVPCRIAPSATRQRAEAVVAGRVEAGAYWDLTLQWDQPITPEMRVSVGGSEYEVIGVDDVRSYQTARRVALRRA